MRVFSSDRALRSVQGVGFVAFAILVWGILVDNGLFWSAVAATSVIGTAIATGLVIRDRSLPTLADVIASAEREPAAAARARGGLRRATK